MTQAQKTIQMIRRFVTDSGVSKWELARRAGLHEQTLRNLDSEDFNPQADTLDACEVYIKEHNRKERKNASRRIKA